MPISFILLALLFNFNNFLIKRVIKIQNIKIRIHCKLEKDFDKERYLAFISGILLTVISFYNNILKQSYYYLKWKISISTALLSEIVHWFPSHQSFRIFYTIYRSENVTREFVILNYYLVSIKS